MAVLLQPLQHFLAMAAPGRSLGLSSEPRQRSGLTNRARAEEGWERLEEQKSCTLLLFWYQQSRTMRYSLPPHRTVEEFRATALDVRKLYRRRVLALRHPSGGRPLSRGRLNNVINWRQYGNYPRKLLRQ